MIWLLLFLPTATAVTKCYDSTSSITAAQIGISSSDYQSLTCPSTQFCMSNSKTYGFFPAWAHDYSTAIKRFQTDDSNCNYLTNTGPCESSIQISDSSFSAGTLSSTYTGSGDMIEAAKVSCGKHPNCFAFQKYDSTSIQFMTIPEENPETGTCPESNCKYMMGRQGYSSKTFYYSGNKDYGFNEDFVWSVCVDRPTCTQANSGPFRNMWDLRTTLTGSQVVGQLCDLEISAVDASKTDFLCPGFCTTTECCGDPQGKTCSSWEDCGLTHDCIDGTCQKIKNKCSSDADCLGGDLCVDDGTSSAFTKHHREAYFPHRTHRQHTGMSDAGTIYNYLQNTYKGEPFATGQTNNALFPVIPLGTDWKLATGSNNEHKWENYNYGTPERKWYALKTDASDFDDFVSKAEAKCDEIDCTFFIVMGHSASDLQALFSVGAMSTRKKSQGNHLDGTSYAFSTYERTNKVCKIGGFIPNSRTELTNAIGLCLAENPTGACPNFEASLVPSGQGGGPYGPIGSWNTKRVQYMNSLFANKAQFNQPLSWDFLSATTASSIFEGATSFNSPVQFSNTGKVKSFKKMFKGATAFNQDLSSFDVSSVTDLGYMFWGSGFTKTESIKNWDTSSAIKMDDMFSRTCLEDGKLNWNTGSVTTISSMFYRNTFSAECKVPDISSFDLSSVTSASNLFYGSNFNGSFTISGSDVGNIFRNAHVRGSVIIKNSPSVNAAFKDATIHGDIDLDKWETSSTTGFQDTFAGAKGDLSGVKNWDVTSGNKFYNMFTDSDLKYAPCWAWPVLGTTNDYNGYANIFKNSDVRGKICTDKFTQSNSGTGHSGTVDSSCTNQCADLEETCAADLDCYEQKCVDDKCAMCKVNSDCDNGLICPAGLCIDSTCGQNEFADAFQCKACPPGSDNEAGDSVLVDSECDAISCAKDEKVVSNVCTACPPGTIRPAGDDATQGDTSCTQAVCSENHRVKDNECVPCEDGLIRLAGDRADRADTQCFDASTCGGVTCDPTGTKECVNHRCICNNYFGGQDCSKDRSPSARRQKLVQARKKALPTRANLKQRQKEVKDLAKEILQEEIAKGVSLKQAIKNSKVEVELQDIQQEVQVVVSKMAKTPVIAVGPENKDETDSCDQGPECASLDIAEEGDEITFLDTADDSGSWTALTNGNDIVSKQTKVSEGVYDMQCWNNTWDTATRLDTTSEGKLFECNGHIILVGSQAAICTPTTCHNGGTCSIDGVSFKCDCAVGFTGEFCETSSSMTHCHQMDCSDFGGHKAGECTDCTVANCCNYASRSLFDAHCDTLSATQDYVNAKCCHRTYCL